MPTARKRGDDVDVNRGAGRRLARDLGAVSGEGDKSTGQVRPPAGRREAPAR